MLKFLVLTLFLISGCHSCSHIFLKNSEPQDKQEKIMSTYTFVPERLAHDYSFVSHLEIIVSSATKTPQISYEKISIEGSGARFFLTKKTDEAHFFEILSDHDQLYVKNRGGEWRSGKSNKAYYHEIINDAFNSLGWLVEQCALENILEENAGKYEIKDKIIASNAPLLALVNISPEESHINGFIEIDSESKNPKKASLSIKLLDKTKLELSIKLELSFSPSIHASIPEIPTLVQEEVLTTPVNIATRFKSLMDEGAE